MFFTMISLLINSVYYVFSIVYYLFSFFHTVLPFGLDVGILGISAYYLTRLKKPDLDNVVSIFGPEPWTKESQLHPEKVVRCIAHRGAGLDAPENTLEAFKYANPFCAGRADKSWLEVSGAMPTTHERPNAPIGSDLKTDSAGRVFNKTPIQFTITVQLETSAYPIIEGLKILCVERDCNIVELDVRSSKDGKLLLLHDPGLERLTGTDISNVHVMDWDKIKHIDIGATHPNRKQFKEVHLCLLEDALDYLLANKVRVIIDVKGEDKQVVNGILSVFARKPRLYQYAAVTCFNPFILYQIRKNDPQIVGALSYRPYCFSSQDYDAEHGPNNPRFGDNLAIHGLLRCVDVLHSLVWRWTARWCAVSAVLLHKDIVSPSEVQYWRWLGIRCAGWCVNRPLEKLYWRGVLKAPYLANTLLGEPDIDKKSLEKDSYSSLDRAGPLVDKLLEPDRKMSSGQN